MSELLHSPDAELAALKARVARLERLEGGPHLVWEFDGEGRPKRPHNRE